MAAQHQLFRTKDEARLAEPPAYADAFCRYALYDLASLRSKSIVDAWTHDRYMATLEELLHDEEKAYRSAQSAPEQARRLGHIDVLKCEIRHVTKRARTMHRRYGR